MATADIFNYLKVNDQLSTAGQPTEDQLRDAAAEGFTTCLLYTSIVRRSACAIIARNAGASAWRLPLGNSPHLWRIPCSFKS